MVLAAVVLALALHDEKKKLEVVAAVEMSDARWVAAVALVDIADVGTGDRVVVADDWMMSGVEIADDGDGTEAVDGDGVDQRVANDVGEVDAVRNKAVVLEEALLKTKSHTKDWVSDLDDSSCVLNHFSGHRKMAMREFQVLVILLMNWMRIKGTVGGIRDNASKIGCCLLLFMV